jgi:uncharacterized membrane protein YeaQ/YmgE (transglycosylase-associated protein family)
MDITWVDLITWLIVGALAGPTIGMLVKGRKQGFGIWVNIGIGLVGALLGGVLFAVVPVLRPLATVSINLEDVVSALVGSLLFLLIVRIVKSRKGKAAS